MRSYLKKLISGSRERGIDFDDYRYSYRESKGISEKNICFIVYVKAFDYVDHNKLEYS